MTLLTKTISKEFLPYAFQDATKHCIHSKRRALCTVDIDHALQARHLEAIAFSSFMSLCVYVWHTCSQYASLCWLTGTCLPHLIYKTVYHCF